MSNYEEVLSKLVKFKSKYYTSRLIKGLLLVLAGTLLYFLVLSLLEYVGKFSTTTRTALFYSFVLFSGYLLVRYIAIPIYKLTHLNQYMSDEEASLLIGKHFPEIEDRLINALQLRKQNDESSIGNELLVASIDQKMQKITPVPFVNAVDYTENRRYVKYLAVPLVLITTILLFQSNILTESGERLIKHNQEFKNKAPFDFVLINKSLKATKNESYLIELSTEGTVIPNEVFLSLDGNPIKMKTGKRKGKFSYLISNVHHEHSFSFKSGEFTSDEYSLKLLPQPTMVKFLAQLDFPKYTKLVDKELKNVGDMEVPEGTNVKWVISTKEVTDVNFKSENKRIQPIEKGKNKYIFTKRITNTSDYQVRLKNQYVEERDSVRYIISVIKDKYPGISVEQKIDSGEVSNKYFFGKASDDYGVSKVTFNYKVKNSSNGSSASKSVIIEKNLGLHGSFYYYWDADRLGIGASDEVEYYFEVWDNDGVNGSKSVKSRLFRFAAPTKKELKKKSQENSERLKDELAAAKKKSLELQKKTEELRKDLSEKKSLSWQEKKKIQNLLNEQKELEQKLEKLQEKNNRSNKEQNQFKKPKKELLKKQKQLNKLMKEIMTPEMKELYKKLEELMKQNNKDEIKKHLDKMKMDDKEMEKQLDRALEQMKQMEVEQKMDEAIDKLDELIKKQEDLAKQTENKELKKDEIVQKQEELKESFEELKKDLKDLEKKDSELESPMGINTEKEDQNQVSSDMEESEENATKGKNKKSAGHQKEASKKMEKIKKSLEKQKEEAEEEQNEEDYQTLRGILENLIQLSFDQEDLFVEFSSLRDYNPKYISLSQKQKKIKDDAKIIEDSLFALSKRNIAVEGFINKEVGKMNYHMKGAMDNLKVRHTYRAVRDQQYAMTNMNNLAVMLSEALEQMQEQMREQQKSKQCKNPGKGKPGKKKGNKPGGKMGNMKKQQQKLSKMLGEMKKQMENGKKPTSKEFAKMAAEQEAMRRALQELQKELGEQGKGGKLGDLKKTEELMDDQEKDLVNKRITSETIRRNKEILTRLLEHEKAEEEQELEEKRESNEGKDAERKNPPEVEEYLKKMRREQELLKTIPHDLNPYYKNKVKEYYKKLGS